MKIKVGTQEYAATGALLGALLVAVGSSACSAASTDESRGEGAGTDVESELTGGHDLRIEVKDVLYDDGTSPASPERGRNQHERNDGELVVGVRDDTTHRRVGWKRVLVKKEDNVASVVFSHVLRAGRHYSVALRGYSGWTDRVIGVQANGDVTLHPQGGSEVSASGHFDRGDDVEAFRILTTPLRLPAGIYQYRAPKGSRSSFGQTDETMMKFHVTSDGRLFGLGSIYGCSGYTYDPQVDCGAAMLVYADTKSASLAGGPQNSDHGAFLRAEITEEAGGLRVRGSEYDESETVPGNAACTTAVDVLAQRVSAAPTDCP